MRSGTLAEAVEILDSRPAIGLLAVKQLESDGAVYPSMRRYPTVTRTLVQALGSERWPVVGGRIGERILDLDAYERETPCDWTTGAVMFVRRAALESAGDFDERFFLFSEEADLALRIRQAGWDIVHTPQIAVVHYAGKAGVSPRREAQMAYARQQYAAKHFSRARRLAFTVALGVGHLLRIVALAGREPTDSSSEAASRASLRVLARRDPPPFRPDAPVEQRLDPFGEERVASADVS